MVKTMARLDITADPPILVDMRRCDFCGACVSVCPADCLILRERLLTVIGMACIKCGFCPPACSLGALTWNENSSDEALRETGSNGR